MRASYIAPSALPSFTADTFDPTADLRASFRQAAPRRRRPAPPGNKLVSIFEDKPPVTACPTKSVVTQPSDTNIRSNTVRKFGQGQEQNESTAKPISAVRRQSSAYSFRRSTNFNNVETQEMAKGAKTVLKKEPRRRTIWVPSDDTTVFSIHPGNHGDQTNNTSIFRDVEEDQENEAPKPAISHTTSSVQAPPAQPRRASRRQSLAQAPRRGVPLQTALQPVQESVVSIDHAGANTGKENIPPGSLLIDDTKKTLNNKKPRASQILLKRRASVLPPLDINPSVSTNSSNLTGKRNLTSPVEKTTDHKAHRPSSMHVSRLSTFPSQSQPITKQESVKGVSASKLYKPRLTTSSIQKYPMIYENIEQPSMFEDSWLGNQETAMVELINRLFASSSPSLKSCNASTLRQDFLNLYQERSTLLLYQRLQASLQFGALSLPKERESTSEVSRYVNDIGLRRQFIRLFMKSYDEKALRAAVEVVTGRQVATDDDRTLMTSDLEQFISSCLLRNEDLPLQRSEATKSAPWNWRRTMQRGLMLIFLLDTAKEQKLFTKNLFKTSSTHKSSTSVLNEFTSILLPWGSDITRALGHLEFQLNHDQPILSEFDYTISNLAVDLRDGIRLTRLVEILLYPSSSKKRLSDEQTISMPSGEILDTSQGSYIVGVLSQHLKYPCISRACKAYNNQIALSALLSVRSIAEVAAKTTTNDFVDGHCENTLALLWALVSQWGLNSLMDWCDVRSELIRIAPQTVPDSLRTKDLTSPSPRTQKQLLKDWSSAIASKNGLCVNNMTTSFANGMIFERIVDEYQRYLAPGLTSSEAPTGLDQKLKGLGCSAAFADIFGSSSSQAHFFDEDFTFATLAFLASRLLNPSRAMREKRQVLKGIAEDCAVIVQTREKITNAAIVLQKAWRKHYAWRLEQYEKGVVDIWLA